MHLLYVFRSFAMLRMTIIYASVLGASGAFGAGAAFGAAGLAAASAGASTFGLRRGKLTAWIAPFGHSGSHLRHDLHLAGSMYAKLFSSTMASNGHTFTHLPQPIQLALQALLAIAPLSLFTHITTIRRLFLPFGRISMIRRGQALAQAPQAVHFCSSTSGRPVSGLMWIASNLHASTQSPQPNQPNAQPVSPPDVA